ncbi:D-2-hydroxyacid dehydrogenase [Laedolimicola ammoniilytica]|uniref:D-2-hydroxyacid dehydrogenase n=1 Tax=Laedolimicola ammoniilytica TaxID=2981771 RepID=A0ABT2S0S6_9FIRM|nr:D-2-hydroxyacid dehydrogenase [Laedolimicola ammoniilytica]MCU6698190.1 D-2-hydroxyacid dehydrogenase [Laedolimicola ammoniilytica]SCI67441.1 Glycerate dehydrogenase [uncultured Clostridium sp.]
MKIVVLDGYTENPGDLSWSRLEELGEFIVYDRSSLTDEDEAISRIGEAEIVITNKTPITKRVLDSCPSIRYIGVLATGYNVVDYTYAAKKGIPVTNVPGYGTDTVAQFTFALLLEICHHVAHHSEAVHAGRWEQSPDFCFCDYPQIELAGKTMGIIGFGRIGQKVGTIAKAFGMKVLAHSPHEYASGKAIGTYVNLDTLLAESDVISLHCPLFPETEGIINQATIAKMKDGVILLNNGRGPLVVEQDLADALNSGKIRAAAVDVVSAEPIKGDNPLLTAKNCFITPHIAWATKEARQRIMDCAVNNVKAFLSGAPENVVNQ